MIKFLEQGHIYQSLDNSDRKWLGVTSLVKMLSEPFDREAKSLSCSTRKPGRYPNKWYGFTQKEILEAWDGEGQRSIDLGHWYHNKRETDLLKQDGVIAPIWENGVKIASNQRLTNGIYPEHLIYLDGVGICGQSDLVKVYNDQLTIRDYKTSKEIRREAFGKDSYNGPKMMLSPVSHLEDCDFNHYALQLSLYAHMIIKHNPLFKVKDLIIEHVKFEESGKDKYGYPLYAKDSTGDFIVREIEEIPLPSLNKEVQGIIHWLKTK